jgi:GTP-binding nuclear protein Ran
MAAVTAVPTFNINFLGDGGVGKTTWIHKMNTTEFNRQYHPTVGYNVHRFNIRTNYGTILLNLFDCAGQEKYTEYALPKGDATILMFDLTSRISSKSLKLWRSKCETGKVFFVGNKSDCADRKVSTRRPYLPVSAKRMGINDLLTPILRRLTGHDDLVIVE